MEVNGAPKQPDYKLSSKYLPLCLTEQRHLYRFGTTWEWVIIFIFGWTIPLIHFIITNWLDWSDRAPQHSRSQPAIVGVYVHDRSGRFVERLPKERWLRHYQQRKCQGYHWKNKGYDQAGGRTRVNIWKDFKHWRGLSMMLKMDAEVCLYWTRE